MSRAATPRARDSAPKPDPEPVVADEEDLDEAAGDLPEEIEEDSEGPDEWAEESGIDLTDASDLDADNVPADEEFDRVMQAPD